MRPCSGWINLPIASHSGAPLYSNPQRTRNSSKPESQPMPDASSCGTNCGWTGPRTGDVQPSFDVVAFGPVRMPMPRVGTSVIRSRPLSTSTTSTPSRSPPRSVRLRSENFGKPSTDVRRADVQGLDITVAVDVGENPSAGGHATIPLPGRALSLAMANASAHSALLTTHFATSLTGLLDTHDFTLRNILMNYRSNDGGSV